MDPHLPGWLVFVSELGSKATATVPVTNLSWPLPVSMSIPSSGQTLPLLDLRRLFLSSSTPAPPQPAQRLPLPLLPHQCSLLCHRPQQLLLKQPLCFSNSFHKLPLTGPPLSYLPSSAETCVPRDEKLRGRMSRSY